MGDLINALIAVKNSPGYGTFRDYLNKNIEDWRTQLERPDVTDPGAVGYVRGQIVAYKNLVNLFETHLDLIKQANSSNPSGEDRQTEGQLNP